MFELLFDVVVDVYFREASFVFGVFIVFGVFTVFGVFGLFKTPETVYSKLVTQGAFLYSE